MRAHGALLIDEQYASVQVAAARAAGISVGVPAEWPGSFPLRWAAEPMERALTGTFVKVLVRHRPDYAPATVGAQLGHLRTLSAWCRGHGQPLVLEVVVPRAGEPEDDFESVGRSPIVAAYVRRAYAEGIVPEFWKMEGTTSAEAAAVVDAAIAEQPAPRFLVLGKGTGADLVVRWFATAKGMRTAAGFAVGRTIYMAPVSAWLTGGLTREAAVELARDRVAPAVRGAEAAAAHRLGQAADAAEPVVVEQQDGHPRVFLHGGDDLARHHQAGPVAHHHVGLVVGRRQAHPEPARDLVAHRRVAVLEVIGVGARGAPEAVEVAGKAAGSTHHRVLVAGEDVQHANHRVLRERPAVLRRDDGIDLGVPGGAQLGDPRAVGVGGPPRTGALDEQGSEFVERHARVAGQRQRAGLVRVEFADVDGDEGHRRVGKRGAGGGGEVAQPRTDQQHDVRVARVRLAARLPVTPIAPSCCGWFHGRLPLPACVSATPMPVVSTNRRRASVASL